MNCSLSLLSGILAISASTSFLFAEATPRDIKFQAATDSIFDALVQIRRDIHAHPELSNQEVRTAALVAKRLEELGLKVQTGVAKHGVVGLLDSGKPGPCVAIRADMDALPIKELRSISYRSQNPGVMHACGHDVHTTVALGVAEVLSSHKDLWKGSVKFIFQPAEEGMPSNFTEEWGAKQMITEKVLENPKPEAIFGLHCRPNITSAEAPTEASIPLLAGQLAYAMGPDSANSDTFTVKIKGKMAHGSTPHRGVDSIVVASEIITSLQTIRSRKSDTRQPLVITVGTIQGGQRHNILADEVVFGGTVRTYDAEFRDQVVAHMERILKGVTEAHEASYELEYRKGYPSTYNQPALVKQTLPSMLRLVGEENLKTMVPGMGGEDFSYFAQQIPGFYFRLGVAGADGKVYGETHTPSFDVDENSIKTGVTVMCAAICDFLDP